MVAGNSVENGGGDGELHGFATAKDSSTTTTPMTTATAPPPPPPTTTTTTMPTTTTHSAFTTVGYAATMMISTAAVIEKTVGEAATTLALPDEPAARKADAATELPKFPYPMMMTLM